MFDFLSSVFSTAAILDYLGLESKRSRQARVLTYTSLVLSGAAVGAVVALLLAPKAGRELRADMGSRARQLSSRGKGRMGSYQSQQGANAAPEPLSGI